MSIIALNIFIPAGQFLIPAVVSIDILGSATKLDAYGLSPE
jgi:hypothetical protein